MIFERELPTHRVSTHRLNLKPERILRFEIHNEFYKMTEEKNDFIPVEIPLDLLW